MKERLYPRASITPKGEKALRGGHPWVYADEVTSLSAIPQDGTPVDVFSSKDKYLGTGFYNSHSKIRIRILSRNANDTFDAAYWERRLRYAVAYRRTVMGETDFRCCRLIFGEADGFPGLTVDRFENVLVAQVLSLGTELIRDTLFSSLVTLLREEFGAVIDTLYLRNDVAIRELEGMESYTGFYTTEGLELRSETDERAASAADGRDFGTTAITENGIQYTVDYVNGQKRAFSWIRSTTAAPSVRSARARPCWTASPIPVPSASTPQQAEPKEWYRWTFRPTPWPRRRKTLTPTGFRI